LYLQAQALRELDRIEEARRIFRKSRDEDICPLRALTSVREIVADVAQAENTGFVDYVSIIRQYSPDGIPGSELFLDHVHPTIEGNRLLALAILEELKQEGIVSGSAMWDENLVAEISRDLENSLDERTHAQALRKLSRVLTWAGKHDEAERLINLAMEMIPEDSKAQIQKGVLLWREGDREAALVHYREAATIDPMNAGVHRSLGILLSELNRMTEAEPELEEAIRLDPELNHVYYDLGIVKEALGKVKEAENAYLRALELDPKHAKSYNNLGVVLAKSGNIAAAYEQFTRAVELDPDNAEAAANLERARVAMGMEPNER
jgi:tetratricopeptide (TPR) repeat protein